MNAQQLKNAILQEAIEGRLVPHDPNDEPASALLARIRKEKERLVKAGKLKKKDLEVKPISEDEIPFEIPESWEWVRLSQLCVRFSTGPFGTMVHKEDYVDSVGHPLVNPTNIKNGHICSEGIKMVSDYKYEELSGYVLQCDDFVLARRGDLSKIAIVSKHEEGWLAGTGAFFMHFIGGLFLPYFIQLYSTSYCQNYLLDQSVGGTMNNLNQKLLADFIMPIPPLAEQQRIVAKIEELLPKVEEYGKAQDALNKLNVELPERLKKSILQEAIEGRLVPQDPNDEPASVLLAKIRKEKEQLVKEGKLKKKDLIETPISEDEIPFEIPESWEWVRHNELFEISGGSQPPKSHFSEIKKDGYVRLYQIRDYGENPIPVYIPASEASKMTIKGDILLARYGGSLGKVFFAEEGAYNVAMAKVVYLFDKDLVYQNFLYWYYKGNLYQDLVKGNNRSAQGGFNKDDLSSLLFPLPPLAEQHRIVEKLEQLLGEIDKLKK